MRNAFYILLIFCSLLSCENNTKQSDVLIDKFKPIIQGVWNSKDELMKISHSDLPVRVDTGMPYITVMNIETEKIVGDSISVQVGFSDGRGDDLIFKFHPGKHPATIISGTHYELGYKIAEGDTTLNLYFRDGNKATVTEFIRMLHKFPRPQL
jgi:hypothetical protein